MIENLYINKLVLHNRDLSKHKFPLTFTLHFSCDKQVFETRFTLSKFIVISKEIEKFVTH